MLLKLVLVLLIKPFGLLITLDLFKHGVLTLLKFKQELKILLKTNLLRKIVVG